MNPRGTRVRPRAKGGKTRRIAASVVLDALEPERDRGGPPRETRGEPAPLQERDEPRERPCGVERPEPPGPVPGHVDRPLVLRCSRCLRDHPLDRAPVDAL